MSVFVVVVGVRGVLVVTVKVIEVVIMLHRVVSAFRPMGVRSRRVFCDAFVFVLVVIVQGMVMGAVDVICVPFVGEGGVAAGRSVLVLGYGVLCVKLDRKSVV